MQGGLDGRLSPAGGAPFAVEPAPAGAPSIDELIHANASLKNVCDTLSSRIAELEEERARVIHIGRTDSLTGLVNRGAFLSGLTEKLAAASRFGMPIGLYVLDLDRFKAI